jgi:CelD/BcsL family acetyltransferase involved in cellulose biosynthesis
MAWQGKIMNNEEPMSHAVASAKLTPQSLSVSIGSTLEDLPDAATWEALFRTLKVPSISLRREWSTLWWKFLSQSDRHTPYTILLRRDSAVVGFLPLLIELGAGKFPLRTLRVAGNSENPRYDLCPEHVGFVGEQVDDFDFPITKAWDSLHLKYLSSPLSPAFLRRLKMETPESFSANLTGNFQSYLNSLGSRSREYARRLLRKRTNVEFRVAHTLSEMEEQFESLVELHSSRWSGGGAFQTETKREFHYELIRNLPTGIPLLTALIVGGKTIANLYGFRFQDRFEFYQSGVARDESRIQSPGILLHLLTMEHLSNLAVTQYDFLCGETEYKRRLSTSRCTLYSYSGVANRGIALAKWGINRIGAKLRATCPNP